MESLRSGHDPGSAAVTPHTVRDAAFDVLRARGLTDDEIRRLFEAELSGRAAQPRTGGHRG